MRQLSILGPGKTEWHEVGDPQLQGSNDALIRPLAVSVCDADALILRGDRAPFPFPYPFGHEAVGVVVSVGVGVRRVQVGDRVVVPFEISCGTCPACKRGHTAACATVERSEAYGQTPAHATYGFGDATGGHGGALADLLRVPFADAMLLPVPHSVALADAASVGDNLSDAWRLVAPTLRIESEADVLVVAGGGAAPSIGLYAVVLARALGASHVDYLAARSHLLTKAEALGARPLHAATPPRRVGRYRLTVDASGHPEWLATAIRSTDAFGTCASCGIYFGDVAVPLGAAYNQGLRFEIGWVNARAVMPDVLSLLAHGLETSQIHTVASWESAPEVLAGPLPHKLVLERVV